MKELLVPSVLHSSLDSFSAQPWGSVLCHVMMALAAKIYSNVCKEFPGSNTAPLVVCLLLSEWQVKCASNNAGRKQRGAKVVLSSALDCALHLQGREKSCEIDTNLYEYSFLVLWKFNVFIF